MKEKEGFFDIVTDKMTQKYLNIEKRIYKKYFEGKKPYQMEKVPNKEVIENFLDMPDEEKAEASEQFPEQWNQHRTEVNNLMYRRLQRNA